MRPPSSKTWAPHSRVRRTSFLLSLTLVSLLLTPSQAEAVRFSLGLAGDLTPFVIEQADAPNGAGARFGLIPVLDVELSPHLVVGTYTPFTVVRSGGAGSSASSGAESIFGLQLAGRIPFFRQEVPEEIFLYGVARGGFGTVEARAGPFLGLGAGVALTWLDTGRGAFLELSLGRLSIAGLDDRGAFVDRWLVGLTLGFVFRLGGESWRVSAPRPIESR